VIEQAQHQGNVERSQLRGPQYVDVMLRRTKIRQTIRAGDQFGIGDVLRPGIDPQYLATFPRQVAGKIPLVTRNVDDGIPRPVAADHRLQRG